MHLEDDFPGDRQLSVIYDLTDDNQLQIFFSAISDRNTLINMTNHVYFNLGEPDIMQLKLQIAATKFLERTDEGLPTGDIVSLESIGHNLSAWQQVQSFIESNQYDQIVRENGVDHCFILDERDARLPQAELLSESNRVKLSIFSDQPAIQFYTGTFLAAPFEAYQGLCLECQEYTDAVNRPEFPSIVLKSEEEYRRKIIYAFEFV